MFGRTRNCRAARSISAMLPPWLLTMTSLAMPARATLSPISMKARERGFGRERQRAGKRPVLVRGADRLHRQEQRREFFGQQRAHARQIRLRDVGIDADRQMRPVLLDRRDRQHRDAVRARTLPSSGKASRSRFSVAVALHKCRSMFAGSPRFRAENDQLWSAQISTDGACMMLALARRALFAARRCLPPPRKRSSSTRSRSAPTGSPRPSMAASIRRSPTAPTRNTASTSPSCRAVRR